LLAAQWRSIRVTQRQVGHEPDRIAATTIALLGL